MVERREAEVPLLELYDAFARAGFVGMRAYPPISELW
jgi:hypothetical protein